jgi:hypothetical protein
VQIRWKLLAALTVLAVPLSAQTPKPGYLSDSDRMCTATLPGGTTYEVWDRLLLTEWKGKPSYLPLRGLYRPGTGEFLWRASVGFVDKEHAKEMMGKPQKGGPCPQDPGGHILLLQDGEWIDFSAFNGNISVLHSNLKFHTREEAWSYVAAHWQDADSVMAENSSTKFVEEINLYQQLGADFFRPKRLEFHAEGYFYSSLGDVKKTDKGWELEIKGADEPNRATVLLDSNFKLLSVTKDPASH